LIAAISFHKTTYGETQRHQPTKNARPGLLGPVWRWVGHLAEVV